MEARIEFDPEPDWKPLEKVLSSMECAEFMHMGRIGTLQLYKHRHSRRYLNIDCETGLCYIRVGSEYRNLAAHICLAYADGADQEDGWS